MPEGYKYHRVLLKLSGEALMGDTGYGIDPKVVDSLVKQIKEVVDDGVQVAIVVGGGNIFRGLQGTGKGFDRVHGDQMGMLATVINSKALAIFIGLAGSASGMDRAQADYIGMLATCMNALALQDGFRHAGLESRVMSAIEMKQVAETYIRGRAIHHLEKGRVTIFAAGTGSPYCTTDTTAALRALEINAEVLMKATKVDGVYDSDPMKNPDAVRFDTISYKDILANELHVMDSTATSYCMENGMPMIVFDLTVPGNIKRALQGENVGTTIS